MPKVTKKDLQVSDLTKTPDFTAVEEKIADFWDSEQIFQKCLAKTNGAAEYVFYDGPPFATGLPHYGHLVASTVKDVFPRYQTMRGRHVERRWGWDCHGLPIENIVEKDLQLNDHQAIENYGVANFCEACRARVQTYAEQWRSTIRRLGRFVDMDHDYKTMDPEFMDKEWGVFADLWEKNLVYKDYKVMYVCPRCATPLSNFEVTQGYKEVSDISVFVKFRLREPADLGLPAETYFLAWTTTPWTLPGNLLLAVNKDLEYVVAQVGSDYLIVAQARAAEVLAGQEYQILRTLPGSELVGRPYFPVFSYLKDTPEAFRVAEADFVDAEEGTGIVHIAPPYGEDDFKLGKREGVPIVHHVDATGHFLPLVTDFAGLPVKPLVNPHTTDIEIIKWLAARGMLFAKKKIKHTYPHCWRCDSPLLNYATSSFFIKTTAIKDELIANNQLINWLPAHFKDGRFGQWLANVRDWAVSRNRFWGTPLPLWQSAQGDFICVRSKAELERLTGQKVPDLHKHKVDDLIIVQNGREYHRVPEVFDCWFESGSMPYALDQFPADFISEGQDQTRGWFYTLHVLATALKNEPAFKNVLVTGIILANDGKKMSKKLKNYPDPQLVFDKYGADALRLYLLTSPVMKAESLNFDEKGVAQIRRQVNVILWNCFVFWRQTGASLHEWPDIDRQDVNILDKWLRYKAGNLIALFTEKMDCYQVIDAGRIVIDFIDDLSTLYIRLSRDRLRTQAVSQDVLGQTLYTLSLLLAPLTPFLSELLYQNLGGEQLSVHLEKWPQTQEYFLKNPYDEPINLLKEVLTTGNAARRKLGIKNRQPLAGLTVSLTGAQAKIWQEYPDLSNLTAEELNVKKIMINSSKNNELSIEFDTNITKELLLEGQARELIRDISRQRKHLGLAADDDWEVEVEEIPEGWQAEIERRTGSRLKVKSKT